MTPVARLSLAAVVGGTLGAAALGPVGAAVGAGLGAWFAHLMTPAATRVQKEQAAAALQSTMAPDELRSVARSLDSAGLGAPLRIRANLIEKPDPQNRVTLRTAALSSDPAVVMQAARGLQHKGAHATGRMLREYARGLRAVQAAGAMSRPVVSETDSAPTKPGAVTTLADRRRV